jgi:uncharacterized protein (TIGR00290 family)
MRSRSYAMLWSGGKDSALALSRCRARGIDVSALHTFYEAATGRVRFHGTRIEVVEAQAARIGTSFSSDGTSWEEMPAHLESQLAAWKTGGVTGVVLGDIHLADVRAWYEDRVIAAGLEHVEPIWGDPPADLLNEFVVSGGRAVVTCVDLTRLDESWLGRVIDETFVEDITRTQADPCGENGEYHSFVFDGPLLAQPLRWRPGEVRGDGRFAQLDVLLDGRP